MSETDERSLAALEGRAVEAGSTTEGLPVAVGMGPALAAANVPVQSTLVGKRVLYLSLLAILLGLSAGVIAVVLRHLIGLFTNLTFYGRLSTEFVSPAGAVPQLGLWVIGIPVAGGLIVGVMARFGAKRFVGMGFRRRWSRC